MKRATSGTNSHPDGRQASELADSAKAQRVCPTISRPITAQSIDWLADLALTASGGRRLVVLIDGRSGAGKTTLARDLADALTQRLGKPVQTVSLDDVYPGWDGLAAGAAAVPQMLAAVDAGYRRYDWAQARQTGWVALDPKAPIIIEGSGAITQKSEPRATLRIWVDGPEAVRRQAVTARDGDVTAWWADWSAQEQAHIEADDPIHRASVLLHEQ